MIYGRLLYDNLNDRLLVSNPLQERELHCGDCFDVLKKGHWQNVRYELGHDDEFIFLDETMCRVDVDCIGNTEVRVKA